MSPPLLRLAGFGPRAMALLVRLRLNEIGPLATLTLLSLSALAFVGLADEVAEGTTARFDRRILLALRNPTDLSDPIGPRWFEEMMRDVTGLGGVFVLTYVSLGATAYLLLSGKRRAALLVVLAVGGGMLLSEGLKQLYERPRPDLVPHGTTVFTTSFPSSHAMMSAATYLTLAALLARVERRRRVKAFTIGAGIATTLLIGCSRLYLGVHWPSDVLAGWCGGAAWASVCWYVALLLQVKGKVETASPQPVGGAAPPAG